MILEKISSALAHLEDITPIEEKELDDHHQVHLKTAMDLLNTVVIELIHARSLNTP